MILGEQLDKVSQTLSILRHSDFEFQLTGSRFFGPSDLGSDWDFFVQDDEQVRNFLLHHGFKICSSMSEALSEEQLKQYMLAREHGHFSDLYVKENIHVQVVEDFELKNKIQSLLKTFNLGHFSKKVRSQMWTLAYKCHEEFSQTMLGQPML